MPPPEIKKRATKSSKEANMGATPVLVLGEGTSANHGALLGPVASMLGSLSMAKKILEGVTPPANKEKLDKLSLDQVVKKFFNIFGQVSIWFQSWFLFLYFH